MSNVQLTNNIVLRPNQFISVMEIPLCKKKIAIRIAGAPQYIE